MKWQIGVMSNEAPPTRRDVFAAVKTLHIPLLLSTCAQDSNVWHGMML
jgi:hypothetical protein